MNTPATQLPRVVFFGSGEFGVPVLNALHAAGAVALVVSQPDKPAGRGSALTPTPVSAWALAHGLPLLRPADCNAPEACAAIRSAAAHGASGGGPAGARLPYVVIAYGQKMGPALLEGVFAINLHGSLLPRWRGAAPYQRAIMAGDAEAGVTVIQVAERMDAGLMYAKAALPIGPAMTAAELHDALSALGPATMLPVLQEWHASGGARPVGLPQDERLATRARKLSRADAWVDLTQTADAVRATINGLSPWPGCAVLVGGQPLKVLRARVAEAGPAAHAAQAQGASHAAPAHAAPPPGTLLPDHTVACGRGAVAFLDVQPAGGKAMPFADWLRGRRVAPGAQVESAPQEAGA